MTNKIKNLNNPFIALRHKNFRYYWFGMCVSLIGTWMQNIAQPWLAYTLTKSPLLLSLVGAMQFTPVLLFSLFAGPFIDRFSKKKILLFTQTTSAIITLLLAILIATDNIRYWHILVMAAALGMVNTLDMPARQAFVIELVGKEDLMNAIALNSSVFNAARIVGPAIAGVLMGVAGIAPCFFINFLSFFAVIMGLLFIKPVHVQKTDNNDVDILCSIKDGLKYIYSNDILLKTLLSTAIMGTFAVNYNVLVPVFTRVVLKREETGFGLLMSFLGIGSLIGALSIASRSKSGPNKFILKFAPPAVSTFLIITAFMDIYLLAGLSIAVTGFFFVAFSSTANSTMQLNTRDEYRGRVMSAYTLVFGGLVPIGNLYAGFFTENFGPRAGFVACGVIIAVLFAFLHMKNSKR
jgi:MFS family permease